jgi:hypothetical protein
MKLLQLLIVFWVALTLFWQTASAQYADWKESGSIYLNTTPEGADLPAEASVEHFPLLLRLHRDFFNFETAAPKGDDVRFSMKGEALAYQIEYWDATRGKASIWVRIPKIQGNSQQEIKIHWDKKDAKSESDGKKVFNESNGYLSVLHMGDNLVDEVGSVETENIGTTAIEGMIGTASHLAGGQGVLCGEKITTFPIGANAHSTEAWLRGEKSNGRALGWGNEHGQGKVIMHFVSPPRINMECYFSGANVESVGRLPMNEWIQVVHTYQQGDSRIYINGELSNVSQTADAPLAIKTPARFYIGGWYNNYDFVGDIDEVRISKVVRSPYWIKLQHQNQKELQTLVGPVVQAGSTFRLSPSSAVVAEGERVDINVEAGGARKIYWLLKRDGQQSIAAVDQLRYTFEAGRITGDQTVVLQCKALFADGVKTRDVAIAVKEKIPEPIFTLEAPKNWDGRATIEVTPKLANLEAMQSENAVDFKTEWSAGPFAVIKEILPGKLVLKRSQNSGKLTVKATISNGGKPVSQSVDIVVTEPKRDAWVEREPAKEEKPEEGQFYARDDKNEGTLHYNGVLADNVESVFLRLYADDKLIHTTTAKPAADRSYALKVKLKPGLIKYKIEFGIDGDQVLDTVGNIVCGDAYIIDGQSNALATDTAEKAPPETNEWIRSYARPSPNPKDNVGNLWVLPVWKSQQGEKAELGWWGMELAKRLVASQKMPIFIVNGAVGGTRIDMHQRNPEDPTDLTTIYGRMLWRVQKAKLTHGIRGILWHQGENDQGADGPTGGYGWETYHAFFIEMAAAWKQDFPNVQQYYVFQIWPNSCAMGGRFGSGDMLREKQRTLPQLFSNLSIMSTLGTRPPGGCHFPLVGWAEFARTIQPLIERDHYAVIPAGPISAPNLLSVSFNASRDMLQLEFDQPIVWDDKLASQFYLDGEEGKVHSGSVDGAKLSLRLKEPSTATKITYLKEINWNQDTLLTGANGIAALTFCNVLISRNTPTP